MSATIDHAIIAAADRRPRSWLLFLHGVFGAGRNWRTVARQLVGARPEWGAVLVDLRMHGGSQGFSPPHTLEACAADLVALTRSLAVPVKAVLGHSFGGKVALVYAGNPPVDLRQVWVVDVDPSATEPAGSPWEMLRAVKALPSRFQSRAEGIAGLERRGFDARVAQWMAANLERAGDGYRWRLDFSALETLLRDFFQTDLWSVVEAPPTGVEVHFVKAADSSVMSGPSLARVEAIGRATGRVFLHRLRGGHWLNADNPGAIVALLADKLPAEEKASNA